MLVSSFKFDRKYSTDFISIHVKGYIAQLKYYASFCLFIFLFIYTDTYTHSILFISWEIPERNLIVQFMHKNYFLISALCVMCNSSHISLNGH